MQLSFDDQAKLEALYDAMRGNEDLTLLASGGFEGGRYTYVGKVPMALVVANYPKVPEDMDMPSHVMLQRDLDGSRANKIAEYIESNSNDYIFPGLISISEHIEAEHLMENIYRITIPAKSFRYLVDGQGRTGGAGVVLGSSDVIDGQRDCFDIKFVSSEGIEKDNQVFADVNTTPKSVNGSQKAAMDSRKVLAKFSRELVSAVPAFNNQIDFKRASVTQSSDAPHLWTLNQIGQFIKTMTGTTDKSCQVLLANDKDRAYLTGFVGKLFEVLCSNAHMRNALTGEWSATETRESSVIGSAVFFKSLALTAKVIKMHLESGGPGKADWSIINGWEKVDLLHENSEFIGRCKNLRGKYEDKAWNHRAMASYFLDAMGLTKPTELVTVEQELIALRNQTNGES